LEELSRDSTTYMYVGVSTALVMAIAGYLLGRSADHLIESSGTDSLTQLSNRRSFESRLNYEVSRALRYAEPLSLLIVDMDGLKLVNDRAGHAAGDTALLVIAQALTNCARRSDLAARLGGDEFAIIAPSTQVELAAELAERIRTMLASGQVGPLPDDPSRAVTVSIGVADLRSTGEMTSGALLRAADQALYQAKAKGKNQVVVEKSASAPDA
jgi:diguanylate cyclase (GGDEF)-like protein